MSKENKKKTIAKILIANRGEIAVRIIKSCKALGIKTVCVYSSADQGALFTNLSDEAYLIGSGASSESYLKQDKLIEVAKRTNCDAVHPGYGFLSENTEFAKKLEDNDLIFIGPKAHSIEAMGDKACSKALMEKAGVPLIKGYHGSDQSDETLLKQAKEIGFPVLLKASAGGGGKGMKPVFKEDEFKQALDSAKREAKASFGNDDMLIEKYLTNPRHVEVQIFGDSFGNIVHLFDRDCSLQRRHQKVIEEAPAPNIDEAIREKIYDAAINAAKAVDYIGAGTVEFLLDEDGSFYFMEMNTRLQVEHPVTEEITGIDLVEWQIKIASGQELPRKQDQIHRCGHAIEARLYAEDALNDFMPQAGTLTHLMPSEWVRFDSAFAPINGYQNEASKQVSIFYDPMIAKVIIAGENRDEALKEMIKALKNLEIDGLTTNRSFLQACCSHPDFKDLKLSTKFIDNNLADLKESADEKADDITLCLALILLYKGALIKHFSNDPFFETIEATEILNEKSFTLKAINGTITVSNEDGQSFEFDEFEFYDHAFFTDHDGSSYHVSGLIHDQAIKLFTQDGQFKIKWANKNFSEAMGNSDASPELQAPMPAKVVKCFVTSGEAVKAGQSLLVLEAMKMEHQIKAPANGIIKEVFAKEGKQVDEGFELVSFEASKQEAMS